MKILTTILSTLMVIGVSGVQASEWTVDNESSQLSFISTKKQHVGEVHHFTELHGTLSEAGAFVLEIPLASVDTGIDTRNDRMQKMLFEVAEFPSATLEAAVDMEQLKMLSPAESIKMSVDGVLKLHGVEQTLTLDLLLTKLTEGKVLVVSAKPVILKADDYALAKGVEALREVAGLPSISHAVPVSFYLTLVRD